MPNGRVLAVGGIVGPATFIAAWLVLGARSAGYSPLEESISQLAASDAPNRQALVAGLLAFAAGVSLYALALRRWLPGPAWLAALVAGVTTAGVALFPLGSPVSDAVHVGFVGTNYPALVATPLLAAAAMAEHGWRRWARLSVATGTVTALLLGASLVSPLTGLFQRAGLTVVDIWIVASAFQVLRSPSPRTGGVGA